MTNEMHPDEQLAAYIDGLAPAISLDDITGTSRSEITVLPTSLEGEQITMTDPYKQATTPEYVPELAMIDRAAAKRRNRLSVWAGGAVAAAAAVAVIGYMFSGTSPTPTTTSTESSAASEFTESDGSGVPDDSSGEETPGDTVVDTNIANTYVVRTSDGSLINYVSTFDFSGNSSALTVQRSTDGENWEPVEVHGLPTNEAVDIRMSNGLLTAMTYPTYTSESSSPEDPQIAVSTDGLNWTMVETPEGPTAPEGWILHTNVSGAARLPDGRLLVAGNRYSDLDLGARDIDDEDFCGWNIASETADSTVVEIQRCDDRTEAITLEGSVPDEGLLWTVDADGTNPTPVSMPKDGLVPSYLSVFGNDDSVTVLFHTAASAYEEEAYEEVVYRGTTTDAVNWDLEEISGPEVFDGPTADYDGTTYRVAMSGDGDRFQRSEDGGGSWTDIDTAGMDSSVEMIAAGPAGLAVISHPGIGEYDPPSFDYTAPDGTRLTGSLPDVETTWTLTTPGGETFEYQVDDSAVYDPSTSGERSVSSDGNVKMLDQNEPTFTILSPADGSVLLTVDISELLDASDAPDEFFDVVESMTAIAERDGYTLTMKVDNFDSEEASYTLTGPDGTELLSGMLDEGSNPSGEGVELGDDEMMPNLRFFDPATGEDYVTFEAEDLMTAFMAASADAMTQASQPFTVTEQGYTLNGTLPAGEWNVTDPDGDLIASFESPIASDIYGMGIDTPGDDEVRSIDPLTKNVTILSDGEPVVTFAFDDIVAGSGGLVDEFSGSGGAVYFSADNGVTWQELSQINGWVTSLAVGDDEVLLTLGEAHSSTPVRLAVSTN